VERAIRNQPEVYKGRCVAFADESENEITVVAETDVAELSAAEVALREVITTATGITALNIFLVSPRSIPRTTSGKLQRLKTKSMLEQQELQGG
jgi:acyl-coenzyme A synthetase/AMP-(fatty) acid ligase